MYTITKMHRKIFHLYLVENVDDCAHIKREVAPTNVSECVCANECAHVLTYLGTVLLKDLCKTLNLRTHLKLDYNKTSLNYIQKNYRFQALFLSY